MFTLKCGKCKDQQRAINWVEKSNSGCCTMYTLTCSNCNAVLKDSYQSSPRVSVDDNGSVIYCDEGKCKKFSKNNVSLIGVLMNLIAMHHGTQNALFETITNVLVLRIWSSNGIKNHKLAAAKLVRGASDESIVGAKQLELQYIAKHPDEHFDVLISEDDAHIAKANDNAKYCYVFNVNQNINKLTDYDIDSRNENVRSKQLKCK